MFAGAMFAALVQSCQLTIGLAVQDYLPAQILKGDRYEVV
jgi:hypothetical protein